MKGVPLFRRPGGMDIKLYLTSQAIENFPRE